MDQNINILNIVSNELKETDLRIPGLRILKNFEQSADLGDKILVSYYYGRLIRPEDYKRFSLSVNFHPAPLPYYKGVKCGVHAIVNDEKKFGVTCHLIDEHFDHGEILGLSEFKTDPNETGYSLTNKSKDALFQLFIKFIRKIFLGENVGLFDEIQNIQYAIPSSAYYSNSDFEKLKCLTGMDLYSENTDRRLRALWHPDYTDAYYLNDNKQKIFLRIENRS
jgi:methionyl-tRNA formyltransferase